MAAVADKVSSCSRMDRIGIESRAGEERGTVRDSGVAELAEQPRKMAPGMEQLDKRTGSVGNEKELVLNSVRRTVADGRMGWPFGRRMLRGSRPVADSMVADMVEVLVGQEPPMGSSLASETERLAMGWRRLNVMFRACATVGGHAD